MSIRPLTLSLLAGSLFAVSCVNAPARSGSGMPAIAGKWGARGAALEITAVGAVLHESCSEIVFEPITPDAQGQFTVTGKLATYGAGPQQADVPVTTVPVAVSGQIEGEVMTLTITEPNGQPRELTFRQGVRAKVIRCY